MSTMRDTVAAALRCVAEQVEQGILQHDQVARIAKALDTEMQLAQARMAGADAFTCEVCGVTSASLDESLQHARTEHPEALRRKGYSA